MGPHIANDGPWNLSVLIGGPFAILGALALIGAAVVLTLVAVYYRHGDSGSYDLIQSRFGWVVSAVAAWLVAALFIGGMYWAFYPFDGAYHQYRQVDGTVARVESRLLADDHGTTQKYVVVFRGSPQQFAVNDTRGALVRPGDHITIACEKTFVYGGTDGYDCNWGKP